MDRKELLRSLENKEYATLDNLVTEAARIIPHFAGEQRKYRVTVYPDERTVRYYINQGLVDRPSASQGNPARFTYRHLLQILAVKHLQAQYLPLIKIREILSGLPEKKMEEIITGTEELPQAQFNISSPRRRQHSLISRDAPDINYPIERDMKSHRPPIECLRESYNAYEEWFRVSVAEGIELSVRSGAIRGSREEKKEVIEKLAAKIRIYLENEKDRLNSR